MSNLVKHAEEELKLAGLLDKGSDYDGMLGEAALEIVKVFAKQGHSGMSASLTTQLVEKLMRFEPITPLTGSDDEWVDMSDMSSEPTWQNKRCSKIFKGADGRAYNVEGRVFKDPDGSTWTNGGSRVYVEFPYTPVPAEVVYRDADGEALSNPTTPGGVSAPMPSPDLGEGKEK